MSITPSYFPLIGGWNLESPPLATQPGEILDGANYEALIGGGYRRIYGYELYDGQTTASQAVPGTGDVKLVHVYKEELYAIREDGTNGRLYKATASGWSEVDNTFTWSTGGTYKAINHNFFGQDDQEEMYIVNGVDQCVKFDGTTLTSISTGITPTTNDKPSSVAAYQQHLFLAIESSLLCSALGDPSNFDPLDYAFEVAVGDTISDLMSAPSALIVASANTTKILSGSVAADFRLDNMTETGIYPRTLANIGGQVFGLDQQGLVSLSATQAYGNFAFNLLSQKITSYMRNFPLGSIGVINRASSQYRLYNGKSGLYFTFAGPELIGVMRVAYDHDVKCACEGLFSGNAPVSFFGSSDGNVYQLERGQSFAGNQIYAYLVTSFHHHGTPTQYKRFRIVQPDLSVDGTSVTLSISATTDYGKGLISRGNTPALSQTDGALWDFAVWNQFYWDSFYHHDAKVRVSVVGTNLAILISSQTASDSVHTIYGIAVHYSPRRLVR
jgi:hypothetical protein